MNAVEFENRRLRKAVPLDSEVTEPPVLESKVRLKLFISFLNFADPKSFCSRWAQLQPSRCCFASGQRAVWTSRCLMSSAKIPQDDFYRKLDWNLFKVFSIIVECGGITAAAELLDRKQPSISLALKRLEVRLNVRLCERGPSGFELTDEGRALADTCFKLKSLVRGVPDIIADTK